MKREVKVLALSYSQTHVNSYVCVLSEVNGHRKVPFIIKMNDAQTIALKSEGMEAPRPLTHDLIKSVCDSFSISVEYCCVYKIIEGIFYCKIVLSNGVDDTEIEATVGDTIALSLVFDCPLYIEEEVLAFSGVTTDEDGNIVKSSKPKSKKSNSDGKVMTIKDLQKMLNDALSNEDYELAAQLRDKITEIGKE